MSYATQPIKTQLQSESTVGSLSSKPIPLTKRLMQSLGLILNKIISHPITATIWHNYHSMYCVTGIESTETEWPHS